jgi:hypothetical protein
MTAASRQRDFVTLPSFFVSFAEFFLRQNGAARTKGLLVTKKDMTLIWTRTKTALWTMLK